MLFTENEMMANVEKCHLLHGSVEDHTIEINRCSVKTHSVKKLLGAQFDDQLRFDFSH